MFENLTTFAGLFETPANRSLTSDRNRKTGARVFTLVGMLVMAGALFGCSAYRTYEMCGDSGCPGDAKITTSIKETFAQHPELGGPDQVYVQTLNHVVYLTGIVDSGLQRETAESLARDAAGVTRVVNNISVSR
jgi:hypothetical protein